MFSRSRARWRFRRTKSAQRSGCTCCAAARVSRAKFAVPLAARENTWSSASESTRTRARTRAPTATRRSCTTVVWPGTAGHTTAGRTTRRRSRATCAARGFGSAILWPSTTDCTRATRRDVEADIVPAPSTGRPQRKSNSRRPRQGTTFVLDSRDANLDVAERYSPPSRPVDNRFSISDPGEPPDIRLHV